MVKGKGNPCLFLHGGPASGSYFLEKLTGDYLEQHFQMIYLDQRGSGRSTSPKDKNYSMDRMVKDFEEVRTAPDSKGYTWVFCDVKQTADGGLILSGGKGSGTNNNPRDNGLWVLKTNALGEYK